MDNFEVFNTAKYPAYTTAQLKASIASGRGTDAMIAEVSRRAIVAAGDYSVATPGERLRAARAGKKVAA